MASLQSRQKGGFFIFFFSCLPAFLPSCHLPIADFAHRHYYFHTDLLKDPDSRRCPEQDTLPVFNIP